MGIGNVSIGGDGEDLMGAANHYGYMLCPDNKWREFCAHCDAQPGDGDCLICEGLGHLAGAGCNEFADEEMWQYVEDARQSDAEDMALWGDLL